MQASNNSIFSSISHSNIALNKGEIIKEINQCNASLANIENQFKNSHLSRITKGKLLEKRAQQIERLEQLEITLIKLNTLSELITSQSAPLQAPVPNLQNRVTVAPQVPTQIQEIEEEATEKEEIEEDSVQILEKQENSSETLETAIPPQETSEITRSPARTSRETKPIVRSPFWNSGSITGLFSILERTFFYTTGIDSRKLFDRSVSPFNQVLLRRLCLSFGLIAVSTAASLLFRFTVQTNAVAKSVASVSEADLWNQYNNLHYIIRWYLKYQGHSLEWCMRHGPKISQQLVDFIIEKGLLKKWW